MLVFIVLQVLQHAQILRILGFDVSGLAWAPAAGVPVTLRVFKTTERHWANRYPIPHTVIGLEPVNVSTAQDMAASDGAVSCQLNSLLHNNVIFK